MVMASGSQFVVPGQTALLEQAYSLEKKVSLMVLLGEILLMPPCFQLETPMKVVTVIVSDQIREAQILRKVFASVFKKAEFSFFFS